jgi:hypothetical protein
MSLPPPLVEGRSDERETFRLVNALRENVPGPTFGLIPVGSLSLLSMGQRLAVPASNLGWVTEFIDIVPDTISGGAQTIAPVIRIGSNATFDNVAPLLNLGTALVVDTVVPVPLAAAVSQRLAIYVDVQTAGFGPSVLSATVYIAGYYR